MGAMPQSSIEHSAWWTGDRPQARAWRQAGYEVAARVPGLSVTFQRVAPRSEVKVGRRRSDWQELACASVSADHNLRVDLIQCQRRLKTDPGASAES